ncbi:MAG: hypothetical protein IPM95_12565 [Sphingobacteriales bacterium]|nr:hypothetical protein [Sphingobacteriales bacterium]
MKKLNDISCTANINWLCPLTDFGFPYQEKGNFHHSLKCNLNGKISSSKY